ncbi:TPA: terminase small subunit, partial [Pseudomonas aeruginosa]
MALNKKRRLFVEEYLVDLNATQAAIRAGYAPKRAAEMGYELLRVPEVA